MPRIFILFLIVISFVWAEENTEVPETRILLPFDDILISEQENNLLLEAYQLYHEGNFLKDLGGSLLITGTLFFTASGSFILWGLFTEKEDNRFFLLSGSLALFNAGIIYAGYRVHQWGNHKIITAKRRRSQLQTSSRFQLNPTINIQRQRAGAVFSMTF